MRKLPVSDKLFSEIILEDRLYADKTSYVAKMIKAFKSCFFFSLRRFAKTLLVDASKELFSGDERLLQGHGVAASGW
jgi:hypothetical protein